MRLRDEGLTSSEASGYHTKQKLKGCEQCQKSKFEKSSKKATLSLSSHPNPKGLARRLVFLGGT